MNRLTIFVAFLLLAGTAQNATAQNRKKSQKAKEASLSEEKLEQMIAATQKIVFIDSIVIDKDSFLTQYFLSDDAGRISKYDDFFKTSDQANAYVYVNGLEDKCYFSREATNGTLSLYTSDKFDGQWANPTALEGFGSDSTYRSMNYPFMMADGTTFYFAATGSESIGGYDIFVTRYDSESGTFLKPENVGMPFNSTANDYMFVIDEFNDIGWFATDRNQPGDKVCVYAFIPSDTRQLYSPDEVSEERIRSLARLDRIADTWGDKSELAQARQRIEKLKRDVSRHSTANSFAFVINDRTTYTSLADFKTSTGKEKFKRLNTLNENRTTLGKTLEKARNYYSTANSGERAALKAEILQSEQQIESLNKQIRELEKDIRNAENSAK